MFGSMIVDSKGKVESVASHRHSVSANTYLQ
jgi:hypothetical protein